MAERKEEKLQNEIDKKLKSSELNIVQKIPKNQKMTILVGGNFDENQKTEIAKLEEYFFKIGLDFAISFDDRKFIFENAKLQKFLAEKKSEISAVKIDFENWEMEIKLKEKENLDLIPELNFSFFDRKISF